MDITANDLEKDKKGFYYPHPEYGRISVDITRTYQSISDQIQDKIKEIIEQPEEEFLDAIDYWDGGLTALVTHIKSQPKDKILEVALYAKKILERHVEEIEDMDVVYSATYKFAYISALVDEYSPAPQVTEAPEMRHLG